MPASIKKNLYIATNITDLNKQTEVPPNMLGKSGRMLMTTAGKMFEGADEAYLVGDEERAYVLYMKYFNIVTIIKKFAEYKKDPKYFNSMLDQKNLKALEKAEKLCEDLKIRYSEREKELDDEVNKKLESLNATNEPLEAADSQNCADQSTSSVNTSDSVSKADEASKQKLPLDPRAPPGGVTVQATYKLLSSADISVVLMDLRSVKEFSESHIKHSSCINIPSDITPPGSTVTHISKKLPSGSVDLWNSRSSIDYIIMFDWRGSAANLQPKSSLQSLKDALYKWDMDTVLKNEPLVMEGGYEQWLLCYPAITTNANVKCPLPDPDLSLAELSLDDIDYDVELEFLQPPKPPPAVDEPVLTVEQTSSSSNNSISSPVSPPVNSAASIPIFDRSMKPKPAAAASSNAAVSRINNTGPAVKNTDSSMNNDNSVNISYNTGPQKSIDRINNKLGNTSKNTQDSGNNMQPSNERKTNTVAPPPINRRVKPQSNQKTAMEVDDSASSDEDIGNARNFSRAKELERRANEEQESSRREIDALREMKQNESRAVADLLREKKKMENEMKELRQKRKEMQESTRAAEISQMRERSEADKLNTGKDSTPEGNVTVDNTKAADVNGAKQQSNDTAIKEERAKAEAERLRLLKEEESRRIEEKRLAEEIKKKEQELKLKEQELKQQDQQKLEEEAQRQAEMEQARERERKKREEDKEIEKQRELSAERKRVAQEAARRKQMEEEESRRKARTKSDGSSGLPPGWEKRYDASNSKYYYVNHMTKQTQWNPPDLTSTRDVSGTQYKKKLREEGDSAGGSNLKRSHSFHNISALSDKSPHADFSPSPAPSVDRMQKPSPAPSKVTLSANVAAAKVRNLQPTYGSNGSGLTGLRNLGNTCYMNSIVQCLSNTAPLTIYFLSDVYLQYINRNAKTVSRGEVAEEFGALIKALWSNQYRAVSPRDLRSAVCKLDSMFATSQHQDAQELLEYLMSGLNEDLNEVKQKPVLKEQNNDNIPDHRAAQIVWDQSLQVEKSIIVNLFRGQYKSAVTCLKCEKQSVVFEPFMCLSLPIPSSSYCHLTDCLAHFSKEEKLSGDSKWFCPRCNCKRDAIKRIVIWKLPPILFVHLKRFYFQGIWREKMTTNVDFPLRNFDISRYIAGPDKRQPYTLYGVTNHFGTLDGGHYTAYCRSPSASNEWYKFDDQDVFRMPESDVQSSAGYVLFYSCMKLDFGKI